MEILFLYMVGFVYTFGAIEAEEGLIDEQGVGWIIFCLIIWPYTLGWSHTIEKTRG